MSTTDKQQELHTIGQGFYQSIKELVEDLTCDLHGDEYNEDETAREAILNHPLEVTIRNGWHSPGCSPTESDCEYQILIATGGPACRIIGDLDQYNQPHTATLQVQDWFTPWTDVSGCYEDILLTYAQCFYFGE